MNTVKEPSCDARHLRRQLDEMETLLERLLELPLPSRLRIVPPVSRGERERAGTLPLSPASSHSGTGHGPETERGTAESTASATLAPAKVLTLTRNESTADLGEGRGESTSTSALLPVSTTPVPGGLERSNPGKATEPHTGRDAKELVRLPEPLPIDTIKATAVDAPLSGWLRPFAWLDQQAVRWCPPLAHDGVKYTLGGVGLLLFAGAAALTLGRLLGQRWLP